jgi:hypothetical protein
MPVAGGTRGAPLVVANQIHRRTVPASGGSPVRRAGPRVPPIAPSRGASYAQFAQGMARPGPALRGAGADLHVGLGHRLLRATGRPERDPAGATAPTVGDKPEEDR